MRTWFVGLLIALTCALALAATQTIHLKEYLGHTWSNELISYPLDAALKKAPALTVTDETGAELPCQVADGRVYLQVTLPADGEKTFTIAAGASGAQPTAPASAAIDGENLLLDSGTMALRLPAGTVKYPQPVEAGTVPGPLRGVRQGQGGWIGKSWLQVPLKVTGYTTTITATGPLFASATVDYRFEGGKRYTFSAKVIAGQPTAVLDETMDLNPGGKYYLLKYNNDIDASTWEWWNLDNVDGMFVNTSTNGHPANAVFSFYDGLAPNACRWRGAQATQPYKGTTMDGKLYTLWTAGAGEAYAPLTYQKDEAFNRIAGWWVNSLADYSYYFTVLNEAKPETPAVSFSTGRPSRNINPNIDVPNEKWVKQVTGINDLRIWTRTAKDLQVVAPICLGAREWLLTVQPQSTLTPKGSQKKPTAYMAVQKMSFFPLEKVKEWNFDFPEPANAWPRLFCTPGDFATMQARVAAATPEMRQYWMLPAAYQPNAKPADVEKQAITYLKYEVDQALTDDASNNLGWFANNPFIRSSPMWEATMAMPGIDPKVRAKIKAYGVFLAHRSWDDDYWPSKEANNGWGSINMGTLAAISRVFSAMVLAGDPADAAWRKRSVGYMLGNLNPLLGSDGASISSPSYSMASIEPIVDMALALKYGGEYDAFKHDPRLQKLGQFMIDVLTPPDPRTPLKGDAAQNRVNLWTLGDTQRSLTTGMHEMLALGYAGANDALAGALKTMSARQDHPAGSGFAPTALLIDPKIPFREPDLRSRWYPNYGVFFRDGKPKETWFALRDTQFAIDHFHTDSGAFTLWAKGVPLMLDWGSMYTPYMPQGIYHSRIMWDVQEGEPRPCPGIGKDGCFYKNINYFEHKVEPWTAKGEFFANGMAPQDSLGHIARFAALPAADYLQGAIDVRILRDEPYFSDSPVYGGVGQQPVFKEVKPFGWQRRVLFAKQLADADPLYLLVRDDFTGAAPAKPTASFWIMANELALSENGAHATGQFGVDLDLYVARPAAPTMGKWLFAHNSQHGPEKQFCVRVTQAESQPFLTVLYPRRPEEPAPVITTIAGGDGVKVNIPGATDYAVLAPAAVQFTDGTVSLDAPAGYIRLAGPATTIALSDGGAATAAGITLAAEKAVSLQIAPGRLLLKSAAAQTVRLAGAFFANTVTLDGKPLRAAVKNNTLTLTLPAGEHEVVIK
jgi:hypothetical protein